MNKNEDVPGNAVESRQAYLRMMMRLAEALARFEVVADRCFGRELVLKGMTVKFPGMERPDYMVVVRAQTPEGNVVAFHNAPSFLEAVSGMVARIENESVQWKEDKYG